MNKIKASLKVEYPFFYVTVDLPIQGKTTKVITDQYITSNIYRFEFCFEDSDKNKYWSFF